MTTDTPEPDHLDEQVELASRLFDVPKSLIDTPELRRQKHDPRHAKLFELPALRPEQQRVLPRTMVINPGDRIIIKVPMLVTREVVERVLSAGREIFPGCEVSVIACDDLLVYRPEEGK